MISSAIVLTIASLASQALASPYPALSPSCLGTGFPARSDAVATFCRVYLGKHASTSTVFTTPVVIRTATIGSITTSAAIFVSVIPSTVSSVTTTTASIIPPTTITTAFTTATAYLDNSGDTIAFAKRDVLPTPQSVNRRAANEALPAALVGFSRADLLTICNCYGLPALPPVIRTLAARPSVTLVTKVLPRTVLSRTTTTTISAVATQVSLRVITITAPAPVITVFSPIYVASIDSCPPSAPNTLFLCPEGTAAALTSTDPNYDPNYISCPVFAQDNYTGSCLYWNDDGEPAGSTLSFGSTGDATQDSTRAAVYGNASTDDCPSWSDYTCSATPGGATLTAIPSAVKRSTSSAHVFKKMPKHIPGTRGSKYVHLSKKH